MSPLTRYRDSLAVVRRSYTPEKAQAEAADDLPSFYLYRPLSFWVTPLFLGLRLSADAVTAISIGLVLLMPLAAAFTGRFGTTFVVATMIAFQVLDCTDGNIARTTGRCSPVGRMLDGIASLLMWGLYFISIGILAKHEVGGLLEHRGLECGLLLATLLFAQRGLEDTFESYCGARVRWTPPVPRAPSLDLARFGRPAEQIIAFAGLAIMARFGKVGVFVAGVAAYQITLMVVWSVRFVFAVKSRAS